MLQSVFSYNPSLFGKVENKLFQPTKFFRPFLCNAKISIVLNNLSESTEIAENYVNRIVAFSTKSSKWVTINKRFSRHFTRERLPQLESASIFWEGGRDERGGKGRRNSQFIASAVVRTKMPATQFWTKDFCKSRDAICPSHISIPHKIREPDKFSARSVLMRSTRWIQRRLHIFALKDGNIDEMRMHRMNVALIFPAARSAFSKWMENQF